MLHFISGLIKLLFSLFLALGRCETKRIAYMLCILLNDYFITISPNIISVAQNRYFLSKSLVLSVLVHTLKDLRSS